MYDIFFLGNESSQWHNLKKLYPSAQRVDKNITIGEIQKKSFTNMFWIVREDLILNEFNLNQYRTTKWDDQYVHVFKNGNYFDGLCLIGKKSRISNKEFEHKFFINKKEVDIVASCPRPFDIVFISYYEPFAETNFNNLKNKVKDNKIFWIKDVKGIHQAHIEAAKLVETEMFYVVDADAVVKENFLFDYQIPYYDLNAKTTVHVWRSQNPVNGLEYGNGGIKLLPKYLTINMDTNKPDMTTSISKWFKSMPEISNITAFNTDPFNTWKSAFRECAKLASRIIDRQQDDETQHRLEIWCNNSTDHYALEGAREGRDFGISNRTNLEELRKINDFAWLKEKFNGR